MESEILALDIVPKIFYKLRNFFQRYENILIVDIFQASNYQLSTIRKKLAGKCVLIKARNHAIRYVVTLLANERQELSQLLPFIRGNIMLCGIEGQDPSTEELMAIVQEFTSQTIYKEVTVGMASPVYMYFPSGPSGLPPSDSRLFEKFAIPIRFVKGQISVKEDTLFLKKGEEVTAETRRLCQLINAKPIPVGPKVTHLMNSSGICSVGVLSGNDIIYKAIQNVASVTLVADAPLDNFLLLNDDVLGFFEKCWLTNDDVTTFLEKRYWISKKLIDSNRIDYCKRYITLNSTCSKGSFTRRRSALAYDRVMESIWNKRMLKQIARVFLNRKTNYVCPCQDDEVDGEITFRESVSIVPCTETEKEDYSRIPSPTDIVLCIALDDMNDYNGSIQFENEEPVTIGSGQVCFWSNKRKFRWTRNRSDKPTLCLMLGIDDQQCYCLFD